MTTPGAGESSQMLAGRFRLQRRLGAGGMGEVYEAHDLSRNVLVALKTLPRLDPAALYRFKQEFRLLAGITHPNLVALHELINAGEQWFLTMDLVQGVDFLRWVRPDGAAMPPAPDSIDLQETGLIDPWAPTAGDVSGRPAPGAGFDPARLKAALRQLCAALSALHGADRLHLDIKPSNVLVTPEGRVVVLDFGLVVERSQDAGAVDEPVTGTVAYMAPEQAAGAPLTPAADWYAVGVMLYQSLAGRLPFDGPMMSVLTAKTLAAPDPPSRWNRAVPEALDRLCLRLLAPSVGERAGASDLRVFVLEGPSPKDREESSGRLLVGRAVELEQLNGALSQTSRGRPVTVYVHGASGMGKSALVETFLESIRGLDDVLVLAGRCYEQESVQYKALDGLIDALSRHLRSLPAERLRAMLPRDVALLARLFPVLDRVDAIRDAPRTALSISSEQELRDRAFETLRALLAALASRSRLVLSIDDLQWGDTDSARLINELLWGEGAPPLLFVGGYRSEHAATSACLQTLLAEPTASDVRPDAAPARTTIALGPLDAPDAQRVALVCLGPGVPMAEATAERIAHESAGSPYFIRELVEYVKGELQFTEPGVIVEGITLDEALRRRLARLRPGARRLLEVIAVASRPIAEADAYAAADLTARDPALIGVLRNSHLVQSGGVDDPQVETYHDRIRESVVAQLGAVQLRQTHRRLAETLEARGGVDPEWLGAHLEGAGEPRRAADCYSRSAASAAGALAFDRAAELYRRSMRIDDSPGDVRQARQVALGDALANAGRAGEAAVEYAAAARRASAEAVLDLQRRAGYQLCISGQLAEGRAVLTECLKRVGVTLPSTPRRALVPLAILYARLRALEWLGRLDRLPSPRPSSPAQRVSLDVVWAAAAAWTDVDVRLAAVMQARYLLLARRLGDPAEMARGLAMYARWMAHGGAANHRRTRVLIAAARRFAESGGPYERAMALVGEAWTYFDVYEWARGDRCMDEAEELLRTRCTGVAWELSLVRMTRVAFLRVRGLYRECIEYGQSVLAEARQRGDRYTHTRIGIFAITDEKDVDGDFEGARRALRQVVSRSIRRDFPAQRVQACVQMILHDIAQDRRAMAWRRCRRYWPIITADGTFSVELVRMQVWSARAGAALAAIDDLPSQADALIGEAERAIRRVERLKSEMPQAVAHNLRGSLALRRGDRASALAHFGRAASWFDAHGFRSFGAAARRCQGRLLDTDEGRRLADAADAWFRTQRFGSFAYATIAHVGGLPRAFLQSLDEATSRSSREGRTDDDRREPTRPA